MRILPDLRFWSLVIALTALSLIGSVVKYSLARKGYLSFEKGFAKWEKNAGRKLGPILIGGGLQHFYWLVYQDWVWHYQQWLDLMVSASTNSSSGRFWANFYVVR